MCIGKKRRKWGECPCGDQCSRWKAKVFNAGAMNLHGGTCHALGLNKESRLTLVSLDEIKRESCYQR